jgi:hypothetical protein
MVNKTHATILVIIAAFGIITAFGVPFGDYGDR